MSFVFGLELVGIGLAHVLQLVLGVICATVCTSQRGFERVFARRLFVQKRTRQATEVLAGLSDGLRVKYHTIQAEALAEGLRRSHGVRGDRVGRVHRLRGIFSAFTDAG